MKQGSNKRLLADNVEIMRLSRRNNYLRAGEIEVYGTSIDDIEKQRFSNYFTREFDQSYEERGLTFEPVLFNYMNIRQSCTKDAGHRTVPK